MRHPYSQYSKMELELEGKLVLEILAALMITEIRKDFEAVSEKMDKLANVIERINK